MLITMSFSMCIIDGCQKKIIYDNVTFFLKLQLHNW